MIPILFLLIFFTFYPAWSISPERLQKKEQILSVSTLQEELAGLRCVFFSDTHIGLGLLGNELQQVADAINALQPDIVLFGGDLFESYQQYPGHDAEVIAALASIKAPYGKYAVYGNHDQGGGAANVYPEILAAGGFTLLVNESRQVGDLPLNLIGLDDFLLGNGDLTQVAALIRADCYNILLCHEPDVLAELTEENIDLALSGHTHGGQVCIPIRGPLVLPPLGEKYVSGRYTLPNGTFLYVTQGVGTTKVPLRLLAPPELIYFDWVKEGENNGQNS